MLRETEKQLSFHSMLYNKIPEDHLLKVVDRAVDFSFINPLVAGSYCKNFGRPAKEPEMMTKLLFLEHIYDLSDEKVIERGNYDLPEVAQLSVPVKAPARASPAAALAAPATCAVW